MKTGCVRREKKMKKWNCAACLANSLNGSLGNVYVEAFMKRLLERLVAIAWACMLASGCNRASGPTGPPDLGGPNGLITWSPPAGKDNPLPGIDHGTVYNLGTAFIVWSDAAGGGGGSSSANVQG